MALLSVITEKTRNPASSRPRIVLWIRANRSMAFILQLGWTCTTSLYLDTMLLIKKANADFAASLLLLAAPTMLPPLKSKNCWRWISSTKSITVLSLGCRLSLFLWHNTKTCCHAVQSKSSLLSTTLFYKWCYNMAEDNCRLCAKICWRLVQCCKKQKRIQENRRNNYKRFT